ncbi:MAG: Hsp20/alpha crystallin family protein [Deltaproteobacteria bacterium]|nr:Hsp20/alpha crystallin family protein [Deltaproteobacteria bacterium]
MAILRTPVWQAINWPGFSELERMRSDLDKLFRGLAEGVLTEPGAGVFPLTNVTEDKENYYVRAELPGIKAEDLDISVTGDGLSISGERKIAPAGQGARYHRKEREAGTFSRKITLPGQIDVEKAEASCSNGILTVLLPKAEATKPKQISVKTAD